MQQAVAQVLSEEYEPVFSANSYGFRPNRCAQDTIQKVVANAGEGYEYVIDLDLARFFDTVNHSKLLQVLSKTIKDGRVISLIHKFLRAKIRDGEKIITPTVAPQGGPISPILANILLNELDQEQESRGHRFVRYADDMMIMCKSLRAAKRVYESISRFIEKKLLLSINTEKTKICSLGANVKFPGYTFIKGKLGNNTESTWHASVHAKLRRKLRFQLKSIINRKLIGGLRVVQQKLSMQLGGWFNYFRLGIRKSLVRDLDGWLRRRIRQIYWKQWKRIRTKYEKLRKLGISHEKAYEWANTSKSYWRVAGSAILKTTLTNKVLRSEG